jgi:tetratricopeptide (TPR) repeat protein
VNEQSAIDSWRRRRLKSWLVCLLALGIFFGEGLRSFAQDDDPDLLNRQVLKLYQEGKYQEAIPIAEKFLAMTKRTLGSDDPNTAASLNNLALLYLETGAYAKAEPLYQQALQIFQKALGPDHPATALSLHNLAALYFEMGTYKKAEPLYQQALQISQKTLGPDHPHTALFLENLGLLKFDVGEMHEAKSLAQQSARARLTMLSKILAFTSEEQRLAYEATIDPYSLFTIIKRSEADLASAVLRYKGVILDSLIEDRLVAEASKESQDLYSPGWRAYRIRAVLALSGERSVATKRLSRS